MKVRITHKGNVSIKLNLLQAEHLWDILNLSHTINYGSHDVSFEKVEATADAIWNALDEAGVKP